MEIFIDNTSTGEVYTLNVTADMRLREACDEISNQSGIDPNLIALLYEGENIVKLIGNDPLVSLGISGGENMQLSLSIKAQAIKDLSRIGITICKDTNYDFELQVIIRGDYHGSRIELLKLMDQAGVSITNSHKVLSRALRHEELFIKLLEMGGNINCVNPRGETLFHNCLNHDTQIFRMLTRLNADLQMTTSAIHPLLLAVIHYNYDFIQACLGNMDLDAPRDINGKTALHIAVSKNHQSIDVLLEGGASLLIKDHNGFNAVHHSMSSCENTITLLSKHADFKEALRAKDNYGRTPRFVLQTEECRKYNLVLLGVFEENGITTSPPDNNGNTVLHFQAEFDEISHSEAPAMGDFSAVNCNGDTPILCAIRKGNSKAVKDLLVLGPKNIVNDKSRQGNTTLHCAVINLKVDVMFMLLEAGVDITACNCAGKTAFDITNGHVLKQVLNRFENKTPPPSGVNEKIKYKQKTKSQSGGFSIREVGFVVLALCWFLLLLFPDLVTFIVEYVGGYSMITSVVSVISERHEILKISNYTSALSEQVANKLSSLNISYVEYAADVESPFSYLPSVATWINDGLMAVCRKASILFM